MNMKDALGKVGLPRVAALAAGAPTIADVDEDFAAAEDIVAACFYEVEQPQGPSASAGSSKVVAVTESGGLILSSRNENKHSVTRISPCNIANLVVRGEPNTEVPAGFWTEVSFGVELFRPVEGKEHFEFQPLPYEGEGQYVYDEPHESDRALLRVAQALSPRL